MQCWLRFLRDGSGIEAYEAGRVSPHSTYDSLAIVYIALYMLCGRGTLWGRVASCDAVFWWARSCWYCFSHILQIPFCLRLSTWVEFSSFRCTCSPPILLAHVLSRCGRVGESISLLMDSGIIDRATLPPRCEEESWSREIRVWRILKDEKPLHHAWQRTPGRSYA